MTSKGRVCEDMTNECFADRVRLFPLSSTDKIVIKTGSKKKEYTTEKEKIYN